MKKQVQVKCPSEKCGHLFSATVDLPDPEAVDLTPYQAEAAKATAERDAIASTLKQREEEIAKTAREMAEFVTHVGADPAAQVEHVFACPGCQEVLGKRLAQKRDDWQKALSRLEIRELARKHGDWPPPSVSFGLSKAAR